MFEYSVELKPSAKKELDRLSGKLGSVLIFASVSRWRFAGDRSFSSDIHESHKALGFSP